MTLLQPSDFQYQGCLRFPNITGAMVRGLAYRPDTNTFFVIGIVAGMGYPLFEVNLTAPKAFLGNAPAMTIARYWGELNVGGALNLFDKGGKSLPMQSIDGLHWDAETQTLWGSFGSYYANGTDTNCIFAAKIDTNATANAKAVQPPAVTPGLSIAGVWGVDTHSDLVKGTINPAPPSLAAATGKKFACFGIRGSTAQGQSWGTGLVAVGDPLVVANGGQVPSEKVIHWPMEGFGTGNDPAGSGSPYSEFPRDNLFAYINNGGDGNATNPGTGAIVIPPNGRYQQLDGMDQFSWIETTTGKTALIYFGHVCRGYLWYGNYDTHYDFTSLIWPPSKCIDTYETSRGTHAERYDPAFWLTDPAAVIGAVGKGGAPVLPYHAGDPTWLGSKSAFVPQIIGYKFGDHYWDKANGLLYVLTHGSRLPYWISIVNVWKVA